MNQHRAGSGRKRFVQSIGEEPDLTPGPAESLDAVCSGNQDQRLGRVVRAEARDIDRQRFVQ